MRKELENLIEAIKENKLVFLHGPVGSGKTYLAHHFLEPLYQAFKASNDDSKIFVLFESFKFDSCERKQYALTTTEAIYYHNEEIHEQKCLEAVEALKLVDRGMEQSLCNSPTGWKSLCEELKKKRYTVIIVLDDYDVWRKDKKPEDFALLAELLKTEPSKTKTRFVLTSRTDDERLLNISPSEDNFLRKIRYFEKIDIRLPSLNETEEIVQDCLQKTSGDLGNFDLSNYMEEISEITGNYPSLVVSFVSELAQNPNLRNISQEKDGTKIDKVIEKTKDKSKFIENLACLWKLLTDREKKVFALAAISQQAEKKLHAVYSAWESGDGAPEWWGVVDTLQRLKKKLLIATKDELEYWMPSSALGDYVLKQPFAKDLALKTSTDIDRKRKKPNKIGGRFLLHVLLVFSGLYLVFLIAQPILSHFKVVELPDKYGFYILVCPLVIYMINLVGLWKRKAN